MINISDTA